MNQSALTIEDLRDDHLWFCPSCYRYFARPAQWRWAQSHYQVRDGKAGSATVRCENSGAFLVPDPHLLAAFRLGGIDAVAAIFGRTANVEKLDMHNSFAIPR